jgi:3-oxoacyl-[acyl-carrier protein] reductase
MTERKRAIITGASSGVGRAAAVRFAAEGWDVCLTARRAGELELLLGELAPGEHLAVPGDYSQETTAQAIADQVAERWGALDALINCAGVYFPVHSINTPLAEWQPAFDIMVKGALYLTRAAAPLLNDGGRIVHVTSIHGDRAEALATLTKCYGRISAAAVTNLIRITPGMVWG